MIIDSRTEFADAQTGVGTAATKYITNVYDTGSLPVLKDVGTGKTLWLIVQIDTTYAATGGAANVTFKLESDSTANLTTSATIHASSGAIAKGTLVAGYQWSIALPQGMTYERYMGVTATPDTNDITTGAFSAWLALDQASTPYEIYPDAQN